MNTPEEIKKGLIDPEVFCDHCTYNGEPNGCNHPNGFLEECHIGPAFKKSDIGKLIYLNREEAELVCEEINAKLPPKEG